MFTGFDAPNSKIISSRFEMAADGRVRELFVLTKAGDLRAHKLTWTGRVKETDVPGI